MISAVLAAAVIGPAHAGGVKSVAFRPDGQVVATCGWDNQVKVWLTKDGSLRRVLSGHKDHVTDVSFSDDGRFLVSSSADGTVKVWEAFGPRLLRTIRTGTSYVSGVGISSMGTEVYAAGYNNRVMGFSRVNGRKIRDYMGLPSDAYSMGDSGGRYIAGGGPDGGLIIWDRRTARTKTDLGLPETDGIIDIDFHPNDQNTFLFTSLANKVQARDVDGEVAVNLEVNAWSCAWSHDGAMFAFGKNDGSVEGLSFPGMGARLLIDYHNQGVEGLAFSKDGRFGASGSQDGTAALWKADSGELISMLED